MLRVDLEDWAGNKTYALYDNFRVAREEFGFKLRSVGHYSGTAGRCDTKTYKKSRAVSATVHGKDCVDISFYSASA